MRNTLVVAGLLIWMLVGLLWLWPQKRRLLKKHGADKTNDYFIQLAKAGDPDAQRVRVRTWIFIGVGIAGGVLMAITRGS